jgi:hypothetical protein
VAARRPLATRQEAGIELVATALLLLMLLAWML